MREENEVPKLNFGCSGIPTSAPEIVDANFLYKRQRLRARKEHHHRHRSHHQCLVSSAVLTFTRLNRQNVHDQTDC